MEEAKATAVLPLLMGIYVLFYSVWFPAAWGLFAVSVVVGGAAIVRGIRQLNHAKSLPDELATETGKRRARQMGILNSVTHPIWLLGAILLATLGGTRYIVPLIVFVIGAHFLPIARIMGRKLTTCSAEWRWWRRSWPSPRITPRRWLAWVGPSAPAGTRGTWLRTTGRW